MRSTFLIILIILFHLNQFHTVRTNYSARSAENDLLLPLTEKDMRRFILDVMHTFVGYADRVCFQRLTFEGTWQIVIICRRILSVQFVPQNLDIRNIWFSIYKGFIQIKCRLLWLLETRFVYVCDELLLPSYVVRTISVLYQWCWIKFLTILLCLYYPVLNGWSTPMFA